MPINIGFTPHNTLYLFYRTYIKAPAKIHQGVDYMGLENILSTAGLAIQLRKFGLTQYQSEALAAVLANRRISAIGVSRQTRVPITKIYGVLEELEARGYVTQELGRPKRYTSPRPETVMRLLVNSHEKRLEAIKECSKQTIQMIAR